MGIDRYANCNVKMDGTKLVIEIETDPKKVDIQPSASGKTRVVSTTGGAMAVEGGLKLNLTLYK